MTAALLDRIARSRAVCVDHRPTHGDVGAAVGDRALRSVPGDATAFGLVWLMMLMMIVTVSMTLSSRATSRKTSDIASANLRTIPVMNNEVANTGPDLR